MWKKFLLGASLILLVFMLAVLALVVMNIHTKPHGNQQYQGKVMAKPKSLKDNFGANIKENIQVSKRGQADGGMGAYYGNQTKKSKKKELTPQQKALKTANANYTKTGKYTAADRKAIKADIAAMEAKRAKRTKKKK